MIEYRLVEASPSSVVVRHARRSAAPWFFLVATLLFGALILSSVNWQSVDWSIGPLWVVIGFVGFMASAMIAIMLHRSLPHTLRFDRATGLATVESEGEGGIVRWPIRQFAGVELRTSRSSSGSSGTTTVHYVDLVLHDGARLTVFESRGLRQRDEVADVLRSLLADAPDVTTPDTAPPAPGAPFDVAADRREARVAWRSMARPGAVLSLVSCLVFLWMLLGSVIVIMSRFEGAARWLPIGFLLLFGSIPTLLLGFSTYGSMRQHRRRHLLHITDDGLAYSAGGGLIPARDAFMIGRNDLTAVRVQWGASQLDFVTSAPGPDGTPKERVERVSPGRVPLAQVVALEQWLQREMGERWGRAIG